MEKELNKIELKFGFRAVELEGNNPLFIDTMGKL